MLAWGAQDPPSGPEDRSVAVRGQETAVSVLRRRRAHVVSGFRDQVTDGRGSPRAAGLSKRTDGKTEPPSSAPLQGETASSARAGSLPPVRQPDRKLARPSAVDVMIRNQARVVQRLAASDSEFEQLMAAGFRQHEGPRGPEFGSFPSDADRRRLEALAPDALAQARDDLRGWAAALERIVLRVDPSTLLAALISRHCFISAGTYFEPLATNHPVIVELVAPIIAGAAGTGTRPAATIRDLEAIESLYEDAQHLQFIQSFARDLAERRDRPGNAAAVAGQWNFVRGSSYVPHARELVEAVFFDWPAWPTSRLGFSASECADFLKVFLALVEDRFSVWRRELMTSRGPKNPAAVRSHFERVWLSRLPKVVGLGRDDLSAIPDASAAAILELLAISSIESGFRPFFDPNPFWMRPLLEVDGRFFCVSSGPMTTELHFVLDRLQVRTPAYAKHRARRVDRLALDRLKAVFHDAKTWEGLYYHDPADGLCEVDGLLLWEDTLLILEGKGGLVSPVARRGDELRLKRDAGKLLVESQAQCARVIRHLLRPGESVFYGADGRTPVLTLEEGTVRRLLALAPCFENLAGAQFDRVLLPELRAEGQPFLPLYINDLAVICDMLAHPVLVIGYLKWRTLQDVHSRVHAPDELDLLGAFMFGDVRSDLASGVDFVHLANSTTDFDDHYMAEARTQKDGPPRKILATKVQAFVELDRDARPSGWLDSSLALMDLGVAENAAVGGILGRALKVVATGQCYAQALWGVSVAVMDAEVCAEQLLPELSAAPEDPAVRVRVLARIESDDVTILGATTEAWTEFPLDAATT